MYVAAAAASQNGVGTHLLVAPLLQPNQCEQVHLIQWNPIDSGTVATAIVTPCERTLRGTRGMRIPLGVQILSLSCSFWENLAKSYVGAPWRVGAPPPGNPGSATGDKYQGVTNNFGRYYGTCMGVLQNVYRGVQPINVQVGNG